MLFCGPDLFLVVPGPQVVPELVGGDVVGAQAVAVDDGHGERGAPQVLAHAAGAAHVGVLHEQEGQVGGAVGPLSGALMRFFFRF